LIPDDVEPTLNLIDLSLSNPTLKGLKTDITLSLDVRNPRREARIFQFNKNEVLVYVSKLKTKIIPFPQGN